jgi:hypothetical protein
MAFQRTGAPARNQRGENVTARRAPCRHAALESSF